MRTVNIAKLAILGACALLALPALVFAAPQQQQSAAEAAKKAKEQQKTTPKAQTVWTNDTIGTVQGTVNVVGQPSEPPTAAKSPAEGKTGATAVGTAPAVSPEEIAKLATDLADAKRALDSVKTDLDIAQRKFDLDAAQYYGTPNYAANKQGREMLDGEKSAIATKKQDVDAAQKKVDDLEKQIKALGGKVENPQPKPTAPQS